MSKRKGLESATNDDNNNNESEKQQKVSHPIESSDINSQGNTDTDHSIKLGDLYRAVKNPQNLLRIAINLDSVELLKLALFKRASFDKKVSDEEYFPLQYIAYKGAINCFKYAIQYVIKYTVAVQIINGYKYYDIADYITNFTPLQIASIHGKKSIVEFILLEKLADKKEIFDALIEATYEYQSDIVKLLLPLCGDINQIVSDADDDAATLLHIAAKNSSLELIEYFINQGIEIDKGNADNVPALSKSISNGDHETAAWWIQGSNATKLAA